MTGGRSPRLGASDGSLPSCFGTAEGDVSQTEELPVIDPDPLHRTPGVGEQLAMEGVLTADFVVARLLIPPGRRYEEEKARFDPFDRLVEPQPEVRADVAELVRRACEQNIPSFVLVNNKLEGCSPLTIEGLAREIAGA